MNVSRLRVTTKITPMVKRGDLTEAQIIELLTACAGNGTDLLAEAQLLFSNEHYPRAYVLAQLASEECAKAQLLLSLLIFKVAGLNPPMRSFWAWWINHDDKSMFQESWNEVLTWTSVQDWLNLPPEAAKVLAPEWMDGLAVALVAAKRRAPSGSSVREDATYVDFRYGTTYVPKARIDQDLAQRKMAQVATEVARAKEIADARLDVIIQMPDAVEFLRRAVAAMGERIATMREPGQP